MPFLRFSSCPDKNPSLHCYHFFSFRLLYNKSFAELRKKSTFLRPLLPSGINTIKILTRKEKYETKYSCFFTVPLLVVLLFFLQKKIYFILFEETKTMEFSRLNERSILVNECVYVFLCLYRIVTSSSFLKSDKIVAADGERMYENYCVLYFLRHISSSTKAHVC